MTRSITVVIIMLVLSPVVRAQPVHFDDPKLKMLVEDALGVHDPAPTDMLNLHGTFQAIYDEISDLTGLEYATNLEGLNLCGNRISDLSPLAGLTKLRDLFLVGNQISDISPLVGLIGLTWVALNDNPLNWEAYHVYIPLLRSNNPSIFVDYDPCPEAEVPNVVGMTQSQAEAALTAAGFTVGTVSWTASDLPEGTVVTQDPAAGEMASTGTGVDLTLSQFDGGPGPGPVPALPDPLAHWKLDEATGTVAQDAAGSHHGSVRGNPLWQPQGGKIAGALWLDGLGDYVEIADHPDFDLTEQITVAAWILVEAFDKDWQAIVTKGNLAWRLERYGKTNSMSFVCYSPMVSGPPQPWYAAGGVPVNDGQWHHVAGTYDGATVCIYVDGVLGASELVQGPIATNNYSVCIGENSQARGRGWKGLIDDVRVYDEALSESQIQAVMIPAETPLVDLRADDLPYGANVSSWRNHGALGDFTARGTPLVQDVAGRKAVTFDGASWFDGPTSIPGIEGNDTRSIEVWAYNPSIANEETLVHWGHRGGPDGTNLAFNYGNNLAWGAVGHWGVADMGWEGAVTPSPAAYQWWHLVYTYDGTTVRLYANGRPAGQKSVALNTHAGNIIRVAAQGDYTGDAPEITFNFTGSIAEVRIYDGVLTAEEVLALASARQEPAEIE